MKKVRGFSLVELMIATSLSLVVLGAMVYLVLESQRSRATLGCMKTLQDNGRAAIDILAEDISIAGYRGCASMLSTDFVYKSGLDLSGTGLAVDELTYELAMTVPISGFGGMVNATTPINPPLPMLANTRSSEFDSSSGSPLNWADHAPAQLRARQQAYRANQMSFFGPTAPVGTSSYGDLITLRYIGAQGWNLVRAMASPTDVVIVADDGGAAPREGDLVYIGDCANGTIFMVTAVTGPSDVDGISSYTLSHLDVPLGGTDIRNETTSLGGAQTMIFGKDAIVATIDITHYALGVSEYPAGVRSDGSVIEVPALYRSRFISNAVELAAASYESTPEEIAPGVVDLGIIFGVSDSVDEPSRRVRRIANIAETDVLHTVDISVQTVALENCGDGDDDNSDGWSSFTMRFERFLRLRNVRGASDT